MRDLLVLANALALLLLPSCTVERGGKQQLLNPGAETIYRDWHYSQAVRVDDLIVVSGQVAAGEDIETVKDEYFPRNYPAWTAVGVTSLVSPRAKVEVRAVAVRGSGRR